MKETVEQRSAEVSAVLTMEVRRKADRALRQGTDFRPGSSGKVSVGNSGNFISGDTRQKSSAHFGRTQCMLKGKTQEEKTIFLQFYASLKSFPVLSVPSEEIQYPCECSNRRNFMRFRRLPLLSTRLLLSPGQRRRLRPCPRRDSLPEQNRMKGKKVFPIVQN